MQDPELPHVHPEMTVGETEAAMEIPHEARKCVHF